MRARWKAGLLLLLLFLGTIPPALPQSGGALRMVRSGNKADALTQPRAGFALMGGGQDLDEAFRYLCERADGGDFVILRASGDEAYNPYVQKLCPLNSVTTLMMPSRAAAMDPAAAAAIEHAEALFIAGGDQANYIRFWTDTPVQAALNQAIRRGVPLGGTSAGLAVLGEWAYTAEGDKPDDPNLTSALALSNPSGPRVTLVRGFLHLPVLKGIITDSHFARRDRMGRLLAFVARLNAPDAHAGGSVRGVGVEEGAAVLFSAEGKAQVVGHGAAWFIGLAPDSLTFPLNKPLTAGPFDCRRVAAGHQFDLRSWQGEASQYTLTVEAGRTRSSQESGSLY